jgi:membrane dipeptidase
LTVNAQIETGRRAALAILKPSDSDLQHGLELHKDALVIESYGFAPRGSLDVAAMEELLAANASAAEIDSLREDGQMTRCATVDRKEYLEAFEASGVTCVINNAGQEGNSVTTMIKRLARYNYATDLMRDECPRAVCPDDIVAAKEAGRHCLYPSANGVPMVERHETVEDELQFIRIFFQLGIRMAHITYNRANLLGSGCGEANDGGLTDFGHRAVAELNKQGIIVDVAHSGHRTSLEAAQASEKPLVVSHSVVHAMSGHYRGKPDEVIRAVVDTGGTMGICAYPAFLGGSCDINAFLDHIDYVAKNFGADYVTIGTDVAYMNAYWRSKEYHQLYQRFPKARAHWRGLWPQPGVALPEGIGEEAVQSLAWTNWPYFTVGLVQRGYSDSDIRKILGGNMLRVARELWDTRKV